MEQPKAGDAVIVATDNYYGAKKGAIGIIDGGWWYGKEHAMVVFGASTFRSGTGAISCSGGPCPGVAVADLKPTGKMQTVTCWRWAEPRLPRAGGGEDYTIEVPLWEWNGDTRGF